MIDPRAVIDPLAQIAADDLIGARQTADSIVAARPQSPAYAAIANVHVRLANLPAAQTLALRIGDPVARGDVLRQIVSAHCLNDDIKAMDLSAESFTTFNDLIKSLDS